MSLRNNIIIVSSTSKAINKAKVIGKLKVKEILSYEILNYFVNFIDETVDNGSTLYKDRKKDLILLMSELVYRNPDTLCNHKITISTNDPKTNNLAMTNTAPTVNGMEIALTDTFEYTFKVTDFTNNFTDAENDSWDKLLIYPTGLTGTLLYNNIEVTSTLNIDVIDVINLVFTRADENIFSDSLTFRISDDNLNNLYSTITTNTITGTLAIAENEPPVIGDNTVYVENRITTILTLDIFTSQLTPPYNDPENDLIDAIRIEDISLANQGTFYLNGTEVSNGTVITREDMNASLFTHIGPDVDAISSDTFIFMARDEGSLEWVE